MKRVVTAAILIPVVLSVLFRAPFWMFAGVVLLVALLAGREYLQLAAASNLAPLTAVTLVLLFLYVVTRSAIGVQLPWGPWKYAETWATTIYKLSPLLLLVLASFARDLNRVLAASGSSFLALPYIGMTLSELMDVRHRNGGALLIFFFFLIIWVGDASAYYVGRQFGKHRLAPAISPNKSWEGTVASFIGSVLLATLLFRFVEPVSNALVRIRLLDSQTVLGTDAGFHAAVPWVSVVLFAAAANIAAQVGDLVESALKRGAGVKDSGALLPGHGGVLDRIDALLLAIPVLWYYAVFLTRNHLWFLR